MPSIKTYKKIIEAPQLEISYDELSDSPREIEHGIGYFITCEKNRSSPDRNANLEHIVKITGNVAKNTDEHMKYIEGSIEQGNEKVVAIYPVYRYEHGNVVYRRGVAKGFDHSNCGFYIVTDKTLKEYGEHGKPIEALIDGELEIYTAWVNGEVYMFKLYDEKGEEVDSYSGGFYSLNDIKDELGKEWKDENLMDYFK